MEWFPSFCYNKSGDYMDGVLLVEKEKDITSSDVVVKLRKILNTKKIGRI